MNCEFEQKLDCYLDSELPDVEMAQMEQHLRVCPTCAAGALGRLQLKQMTRTVAQRYIAAPEFRLKIQDSIRPGKKAHAGKRWVPVFAAIAALALLLVSINAWVQNSRAQQALGELADLHVSTLASLNPVDIVSTDRHTVKPWFQGKLPFTFNLPEIQNSPFKLTGGRLAYFQQNPGAQLLFEIGKHRISVFIFLNRDAASRLSSGSSLKNSMTFQTETWAEHGLRYFIVGDSNSSDIQALSELLRRADRS